MTDGLYTPKEEAEQFAELLQETVTYTMQMRDMLRQLADDLERIADYPPALRLGADGFSDRATSIRQILERVRADIDEM